jgi:hypothetical protein
LGTDEKELLFYRAKSVPAFIFMIYKYNLLEYLSFVAKLTDIFSPLVSKHTSCFVLTTAENMGFISSNGEL